MISLKRDLYLKIISFFLFLSFFAYGFYVSKDYGVSWDEFENRDYGNIALLNLTSEQIDKEFDHGETHVMSRGSLYLILLKAIENIFDAKDLPRIVHIRHLSNFIFWGTSAVLFFLIIFEQFKSYLLSIIGFLMFVLMPRIFAHSFFNPIDISFLAFTVFYIYSYQKLAINYNYKNLCLAGIFSGLLISSRLIGEFSLLITASYIVFGTEKTIKQKIKDCILYIFTSIIFLYIFWPYLWTDFFRKLVKIHLYIPNYRPIIMDILFDGIVYKSDSLPMTYYIKWIAITLPTMYLLLFIISLVINFKTKAILKSSIFHLSLGLFAVLASTSLAQYSKYNDWRHLYFIYPLIILITVSGIDKISRLNFRAYKAILFLLCLQFCFTLKDMIAYHPLEHIHFNRISGGLHSAIKLYPIEYFGTSFKQGLNYIVKNNTNTVTVFAYPTAPFMDNYLSSSQKIRDQIKIVRHDKDPDYILTNWIFSPHDKLLIKYKDMKLHELKIEDMTYFNIYQKVNP